MASDLWTTTGQGGWCVKVVADYNTTLSLSPQTNPAHSLKANRGVKARTFDLKITSCSFLLMFVLVFKDVKYVQMIFKSLIVF